MRKYPRRYFEEQFSPARLVEKIRDHANANYSKNGWDFVVECYEDEEILEMIKGAKTFHGAKCKMAPILKIKDEMRREAKAMREDFNYVGSRHHY